MCRIDGETRQMNDLQSAHQGSGYCKPGDLLSVIIRAGLAVAAGAGVACGAADRFGARGLYDFTYAAGRWGGMRG